MTSKTASLRPLDLEMLVELLSRAGLQLGQEVLVTVEPGRLSLERDPVAELWGALATAEVKDPQELIDEAMEQEPGLFDDGEA